MKPSRANDLTALVIGAVLIVAVVVCSGVCSGCKLFTAKNVETALTTTEIDCVFASKLTDSEAVADFCGIVAAAIPFIQKMIDIRDGAGRSGVYWDVTVKDPKDASCE